MAKKEYGEASEGMLIGIMVVVMVVSFAAVIVLNKVVHGDCRAAEYTYCQPKKK